MSMRKPFTGGSGNVPPASGGTDFGDPSYDQSYDAGVHLEAKKDHITRGMLLSEEDWSYGDAGGDSGLREEESDPDAKTSKKATTINKMGWWFKDSIRWWAGAFGDLLGGITAFPGKIIDGMLGYSSLSEGPLSSMTRQIGRFIGILVGGLIGGILGIVTIIFAPFLQKTPQQKLDVAVTEVVESLTPAAHVILEKGLGYTPQEMDNIKSTGLQPIIKHIAEAIVAMQEIVVETINVDKTTPVDKQHEMMGVMGSKLEQSKDTATEIVKNASESSIMNTITVLKGLQAMAYSVGSQKDAPALAKLVDLMQVNKGVRNMVYEKFFTKEQESAYGRGKVSVAMFPPPRSWNSPAMGYDAAHSVDDDTTTIRQERNLSFSSPSSL